MATLTETAFYARKFIKYGLIVTVSLLVLRLGLTFFRSIWLRIHTPPPPKVSVGFGQLPKLPFPQQDKPQFQFRLETVSGTTGEFNQQVKVYEMPVAHGGFLALDRATELANNMDFESESIEVSKTEYEWVKNDPLPATLRVDTDTGHFFLDVDWKVRPDLLAGTRAPSEAEAISLVRSWLSSLRQLPKDLASGEAKVEYLKVSGIQVIPALSQSDAQFVRVNLFREALDEFQILPPVPSDSLVNVMFIPSGRGKPQFVQAEYRYLPVDYERSETYPLLASETAWKRLQDGEAYYAKIPEGINMLAIRSISLGYYDPPVQGIYLQPIYIFEGDGGFVAYLQAVDDQWVQQPEQ